MPPERAGVRIVRSAPVRGAVAFVACAAVVGVLYAEVLRDLEATGFGDYQEYHHLWEAARIAVERFGEWPLWNPFQCGGITQYGNPQTQIFHPLFALTFAVGSTVALKLFLLLHAALGMFGAYVYARREERFGVTASALTAIAWAGSGYFAWHCGTGHANFIAFYLTPWLVLSWRGCRRDVRWGAGAGLVMSATVFAGGVYAFPFFVVLSAFELAWPLADARARRRVITGAALAVLVTTLVGGFRLIPILADLQHHPRLERSYDVMSLLELVRAMTWQESQWPLPPVPGQRWLWVEYSAYVGWPVLALGLVGAFFAARTRGARRLLVGATLFGALTLGAFAPWAPWSLLHRLPIFDSLKVPSRFAVLFLFYFTALAGLAFERLVTAWRASPARGRRHALAVAATLLFGVVALDIGAAHRRVLDGKWRDAPVRPRAPVPFFVTEVPQPSQGEGEDLHPVPAVNPELNVGSGYCYSGMRYHGARGLWPGWTPQVRVTPDGRLLADGSTTSTVWATVELPRAGRVVFNRTWAPGWTTNVGELAEDASERMSVDVPPGVHHVVLRYAPPTLPWALGATLLGVLVVAFVLRRRAAARLDGPWAAPLLALAVGATLYVYFDRIERAAAADAGEGRGGWQVRASSFNESSLHRLYHPEHIFDADTRTEWHAAEEPSWVELSVRAARPVAWVRLLNARNAPYLDRGSQRVRVSAWRGRRRVASTTTTLPLRTEGEARWRDVYLGAPHVDRIRVDVLSHVGFSGGLAEVAIVSHPVGFDAIASIRASSEAEGTSIEQVRDGRDDTAWRPAPTDAAPTLELELAAPTSLGGLVIVASGAPDGPPFEVTVHRRGEIVGRSALLRELTHEDEGTAALAMPLFEQAIDYVRIVVDPAVSVAEIRVY